MILRQSTAKAISFGPFLDKADGVTLETGMVSAIDHETTGIMLSKNGGALTVRAQVGSPPAVIASTYDAYGNYIVTLSATDTNTVGTLRMQFSEAATCLPVWQDLQVVEEAVYDALFAAAAPGYLQPATAGRTLVVDANGLADANVVKVGPTGAGTAQTASDLAADIALISIATNAGDLASKTADDGTITTGSNTSGAYTDTASDDNAYWITAPVTPAVDGFGLRQTLRFDLPLERVPTSLEIKGYWNGSGQRVDVYALNSRTAVYDQLTNTGTNLVSRNSEFTYSITIPRDYSDDTGAVNNIVNIELRTASTNTGHRMRVDRALLYHVAETASFTMTAPTVNDIWTAPSRTLTTPGEEPVTVPTTTDILAAINADTDLSALALEATAQSIKGKTDNLPTDPADESLIIAATDAITSAVAAVQVDTDNIQTRIPAALTAAGNMKTDILAVNGTTVTGDGSVATPWGP